MYQYTMICGQIKGNAEDISAIYTGKYQDIHMRQNSGVRNFWQILPNLVLVHLKIV